MHYEFFMTIIIGVHVPDAADDISRGLRTKGNRICMLITFPKNLFSSFDLFRATRALLSIYLSYLFHGPSKPSQSRSNSVPSNNRFM